MNKNPNGKPIFRPATCSSAILFLTAICISVLSFSRLEGADALRIVGWNMESDSTTAQRDSDPDLLKQQMGQKKGVQPWGLCEVLDEMTLAKFEQGAESAV